MTAARPAVFADACVLYSATLRDIAVQSALEKAFILHWSADVQDEWRRALLANRLDIDAAIIARTQNLMDRALPSAAVDGYQFRAAALELPDPDDRHVLAAAFHSGSNIILTFNLSDFPADMLAPHAISAMHPDAFFARIVEDAPLQAVAALRTVRLRLKTPATGRFSVAARPPASRRHR